MPESKTLGQLMSENSNSDKDLAQCKHCEYMWNTASEADRITCPHCSGKTKRENCIVNNESP